jgi:hypothetical protein
MKTLEISKKGGKFEFPIFFKIFRKSRMTRVETNKNCEKGGKWSVFFNKPHFSFSALFSVNLRDSTKKSKKFNYHPNKKEKSIKTQSNRVIIDNKTSFHLQT